MDLPGRTTEAKADMSYMSYKRTMTVKVLANAVLAAAAPYLVACERDDAQLHLAASSAHINNGFPLSDSESQNSPVATLWVTEANGRVRYNGSGVLIAPNVVLASAHQLCGIKNPWVIGATIGNDGVGIATHAEDFLQHPEYKLSHCKRRTAGGADTRGVDLALIYLEDDLWPHNGNFPSLGDLTGRTVRCESGILHNRPDLPVNTKNWAEFTVLFNRTVGRVYGRRYFQTSVHAIPFDQYQYLMPGDSGAPCFDEDGDTILGIVSAGSHYMNNPEDRVADVAHTQYDALWITWNAFAGVDAGITFDLDGDGEEEALRLARSDDGLRIEYLGEGVVASIPVVLPSIPENVYSMGMGTFRGAGEPSIALSADDSLFEQTLTDQPERTPELGTGFVQLVPRFVDSDSYEDLLAFRTDGSCEVFGGGAAGLSPRPDTAAITAAIDQDSVDDVVSVTMKQLRVASTATGLFPTVEVPFTRPERAQLAVGQFRSFVDPAFAGIQDLVVEEGGEVAYCKASGYGGFSLCEWLYLPTGGVAAETVQTTDFDFDGFADLSVELDDGSALLFRGGESQGLGSSLPLDGLPLPTSGAGGVLEVGGASGRTALSVAIEPRGDTVSVQLYEGDNDGAFDQVYADEAYCFQVWSDPCGNLGSCVAGEPQLRGLPLGDIEFRGQDWDTIYSGPAERLRLVAFATDQGRCDVGLAEIAAASDPRPGLNGFRVRGDASLSVVPFEAGTCADPRSGLLSCGALQSAGGCWCDDQCSANGDCCSDYSDVCAGSDPDPLIQAAMDVASSAVTAVSISPSRTLPLAMVTGSAGTGLGTFLDRQWILTSSSVVDANDLVGDLTVEHEGAVVAVAAIARHPELPLVLLKVANPAALDIPADHFLPLYSGTDAELGQERVFDEESSAALPSFMDPRWGENGSLALFGDAGEGLAALVLEPTAWQRMEASDGSGDSLVVLPLAAADSVLSTGAPLLTWNGSLVGITVAAEPMSVTYRDAAGTTQTVEVAVFRQYSLMDPPLGSPAPELSAAHWIQQVRQGRLRNDGNGDGYEDLWGYRTDRRLVLQPMQGTITGGPIEAVYPMATVGWQFRGRGAMGPGITAEFWRRVDGLIYILVHPDGGTAYEISFVLDSEWDIAGLADIDGDRVDDLLLSSDLYDAYYFWLMEPFAVEAEDAPEDPALLVRYGQWFFGPSAGGQELLGASQFSSGSSSTGGEQAAADLLWRNPNTGAVTLWEMTAHWRPCSAADNALLIASCAESGAEDLLAYEFVFSVDQPAVPTYWTPAGTGDFNSDGLGDFAWHASGISAPVTDRGRLRLWLGDDAGGFTAVNVVDQGGNAVVVDPTEIKLGG